MRGEEEDGRRGKKRRGEEERKGEGKKIEEWEDWWRKKLDSLSVTWNKH